jgi:hypothetical protein
MNLSKEEAKQAAKDTNDKFINELCCNYCPKGLANGNQGCLYFFSAYPWCENDVKGEWAVSKPECMLEVSK